jgi:hypothetical protein
MLRAENVAEVVLCAFASLEKPMNLGGDAPQAEATDDGAFDWFLLARSDARVADKPLT